MSLLKGAVIDEYQEEEKAKEVDVFFHSFY
jgi:hypothetical protein